MTGNITKVLNNNRLFRKKEVKDVFLTIAKNEKYKNIWNVHSNKDISVIH